jgi:hypothetical protein
MPSLGAEAREVAVPISLFSLLRRELEEEAGALPTVRALHRAGYESGLLAVRPLHAEAGGDVFAASQEAFWTHLRSYFFKRGWGTLDHHPVHDAVGMLTSRDWAEATVSDEPDPDATCCFSTGFLSGLLSQIAGGPVAVLEVECRTRGGASCDFAFGSEGAIHELYGRLVEGVDLDGALAAL